MGDAERLAGRVEELALQRVFRRKGDRVEQQMQFPEILRDRREHGVQVAIARHVAGMQRRVLAERGRKLLDVLAEPRAGLGPCLGDGPCDGPMVGDAEDEAEFSFKQFWSRHLLDFPANGSQKAQARQWIWLLPCLLDCVPSSKNKAGTLRSGLEIGCGDWI